MITEERWTIRRSIEWEERNDIPRCEICLFPTPPKRITYLDKRDEDGQPDRLAVCDRCMKFQQ